MFERFQFNTGARYTEEGQVIVIAYDAETGLSIFSDKSRGINGVCYIAPNLNQRSVRASVMNSYTYSDYACVNVYQDERRVSFTDPETQEHRDIACDVSRID